MRMRWVWVMMLGQLVTSASVLAQIPGASFYASRPDDPQAIDLTPTHLSAYSLIYAPHTPMTARLRAGWDNDFLLQVLQGIPVV